MSFSVTEAFVEGFKNNIYMLAQQNDSRYFERAQQETQGSKTDYYERLASIEAIEVETRHGDTPLTPQEHTRRACTLSDAELSDLTDKLDRIRLLVNPDSAYVKNFIAALNRRKDKVFIAAALGSARSGEDGETLVALPNSQKLVAIDDDGTTGASKLNAFTLTLVSEMFNDNEVAMDETKYFGYSPRQARDLMNDDKLSNADYAIVKVLVQGKVDTFMGFEFVMSKLHPVNAADVTYTKLTGVVGAGAGTVTAGNGRRCFAWVNSGMIAATGAGGFGLKVRVSERADKRYSMQTYACQSVGAVRMEEVKVVEVICDETK